MKFRIDRTALAKLSGEERKQAELAIREIEERRQEDPLAFYEPHDKQQAFHSFTSQIKFLSGGNQSGKTTAGLADDVIQAIDRDALPEHLKQYKKFEAPFLCRIMAESFPVLETTLIVKLQEFLPRDQLLGGSWRSAYEKDLRVLHFKNGSKFFFQTYEMDVKKMGGATLDRVHYDEEPPLAVFNECRMRVAVREGDQLFTQTPVQGLSWTYDALWQKRGTEVSERVWKGNGLETVVVRMEDNPSMTPEAIELAVAGMSEEEKSARREGRYVALHGLIYGDFRAEPRGSLPSHVVPERPIPENCNVVVGIDPGYKHPAGVVWIYLTPDDTMVIFEAQRFSKLSARQVCKRIHEINAHYNVAPIHYVIDPSARNKNHETGRSLQMEYTDNGVVTIPGQNSVAGGLNRVRERLQKDTLFVRANCAEMIDEFKSYRWKKPPRSGEDTREAPVKLGDDLMDALRYAVMSRPYRPDELQHRDETSLQRMLREDIESYSSQPVEMAMSQLV